MTNRRSGHVLLGVNVLVVGYLPAAWKTPLLEKNAFVDPQYWENIGEIAERGTLDALFLADAPLLGDAAYDANPARLEPTVNWGYLTGATSRIGLVATASTTFNDPFELAERLLSWDNQTGGRHGTSSPHAVCLRRAISGCPTFHFAMIDTNAPANSWMRCGRSDSRRPRAGTCSSTAHSSTSRAVYACRRQDRGIRSSFRRAVRR